MQRQSLLVSMRKAILHLKRADPVLAGIIKEVGAYGIVYTEPDFATLARSIVYQQLSGRVASVIYDRLERAASNGRLTPGALLRLTSEEMRAIGLSKQKISYLRDLAERSASGDIDFAALADAPDAEVFNRLTAVKGIGVWTVQMFLIFGLRRPNVLPSGDLGIRVAVKKAWKLEDLPKPKEIDRMAAGWHPYCSIASWYLWRSLEDKAGL